jgi:hypothetical protein
MIRKAFSLLELFLVIALSGVMIIIAFNFIDTDTLSKEKIKTELTSHLNIITATILQCKELSNIMPLQTDGSLANNTLLSTLECNTTTPYILDGGRGGFIPPPLNNFTPYKATQSGDEFYFSTTTAIGSYNDEALQEMQSSYSVNQYVLTYDATTAYLNFYISR